MKKVLFFLLFLFVIVFLSSEWISIPENTHKELFEHISGDRDALEIGFSLNGYEQKTISEQGKVYQEISYFNEGEFLEIGKPDLPRFTRLVAIPNQGEASLEILSYEDEIISNINIFPQQELQIESQPKITTFVKDQEFYDRGDVFPGKLVELGTPAILRD
ncbi:MAG TPA: hypothetical protein ENL20_09630 [Candidatus Cloacimonetes bacterium]|nr:hypothetical protein [Candidatus Cloacimonadota bacterium]